ncbi:hypothetical protein J8N05_38865 [Streptomyces sp. BH-SS-21]|uniref:Uncharacterized protein n=1 Tax=Streptomyces liliiviolaceus TaxID=2823109 RepID=A0A940Y7U2_9ACTN|nr:hypothetical protein [Streptomyces liliiviolaceus]MBQ0854130.1 hypothetical protein [Streptomyces liliiviolaceus]
MFDNYHAFGGDPGQTFLDLRSDRAREYENFAGTHGWKTADVSAASESVTASASASASEKVTHALLAAAAR